MSLLMILAVIAPAANTNTRNRTGRSCQTRDRRRRSRWIALLDVWPIGWVYARSVSGRIQLGSDTPLLFRDIALVCASEQTPQERVSQRSARLIPHSSHLM